MRETSADGFGRLPIEFKKRLRIGLRGAERRLLEVAAEGAPLEERGS